MNNDNDDDSGEANVRAETVLADQERASYRGSDQ